MTNVTISLSQFKWLQSLKRLMSEYILHLNESQKVFVRNILMICYFFC